MLPEAGPEAPEQTDGLLQLLLLLLLVPAQQPRHHRAAAGESGGQQRRVAKGIALRPPPLDAQKQGGAGDALRVLKLSDVALGLLGTLTTASDLRDMSRRT